MGQFFGAGPVVVVDHRRIARIPPGWSYAQAATVPAAFLTAYFALAHLARVSAGERVLVHAATGGVGMAAVQLAGTGASTCMRRPALAKWEILRGMGFDDDHIANSRTVEFEQKFSAATDGAGMDVVLDCLKEEFVDASLRLLPRGGRFIEMGKADIRDPGEVAATASGCSVSSVRSSERRPGPELVSREMLGELVKLFEAGELRPLPLRSWDIRQASDAYRFLSRARHVGKLVLTVPSAARSRRHGADHGRHRRARDAAGPASGDSSWCPQPVARQPKGPRGRRCRRDRIGAHRARCIRTDRIVRRGGPRFVAGDSWPRYRTSIR